MALRTMRDSARGISATWGGMMHFDHATLNRSKNRILPVEGILERVFGVDLHQQRLKEKRKRKERVAAAGDDGKRRNYIDLTVGRDVPDASKSKKKRNYVAAIIASVTKPPKRKKTEKKKKKKRKRDSDTKEKKRTVKRRKVDDSRHTVMYVIEALPKPGRQTNRTYVGVTNNFDRRIGEHNSEKTGKARRGARYTSGREWKPICIVSGFPTRTAALQLENRMHKTRYSKKVPNPQTKRVRHLCQLMNKERFTRNAPLTASLSLHVHWRHREDRRTIADDQQWPRNVKHHSMPKPLTHDSLVAAAKNG